jgi:hypothetical protein
MALTQFRNDPKAINITKKMSAPKKVEQIEAWFKQARKTIPEIPDPEQTDWQITHKDATIKWIKFEMHNTVGERCYVVIDRTVPFIG